MSIGKDSGPAALYLEDNSMILDLRRRKNKRNGSKLTRHCWCRTCKSTCPVHALGTFIGNYEFGQKPFKNVTAAESLKILREILANVGLPDAHLYRTHDMRRGHALDLQLSGASLYEILTAGEWRSPAFLKYLDMHRLEADAVLQAHVDESDSGCD